MKFLIIFGLILCGSIFVAHSDNTVDAQFSNQNMISVSFENNVLPSYEIPLIPGQTFTLTQNHSWVNDETSRFNLESYTLDGEKVKISRTARGDFTLNIPTDSSHDIMFGAAQQYALSVEGTNDFSYLPSSPTNDNWFDAGTAVSVNVQKTTEIEQNKVRQEVTGWSLDKSEFWNIEDDGSTSFTTPPITMNEYHQVDFFTTFQYKLNVISDFGETTGSGWYEQGVTVPIGINSGGDGLVLNSLSGWDGAEVEYDGNVAQVFIDGPVTVSAKVEKNYSLVIAVIVIPILIVGVIGIKKFKNHTPQVAVEEKPAERIVEKVIEKVVDVPEKKYEDGYDQKLSDYLKEQIESELDTMHSLNIISDSKYSRIKDML
ncbi:hypothetical protein [Nitrosopumilus sp.]|uniref:hypothetical protein n=1 Tax=Nitrosopumilus sp. TaxID=2024843 RepID=UPI00247DB5C9|nr:hypothetical protein [Nitrosopumilus sp.]MCV0431543.1 hypothetical protein [Nitrosopumilus sp.]